MKEQPQRRIQLPIDHRQGDSSDTNCKKKWVENAGIGREFISAAIITIIINQPSNWFLVPFFRPGVNTFPAVPSTSARDWHRNHPEFHPDSLVFHAQNLFFLAPLHFYQFIPNIPNVPIEPMDPDPLGSGGAIRSPAK